MAKAVTASIAIGVALLAVAMLLTPLMDTTTQNTVSFHELNNGSAENVTERLEIAAVDINETDSTVKLENLQDFNSTQQLLNETETKTFNLSGSSIDVNNTEIVTNNTTARYTVTYPPTFAWNDGAAAFFTNLDLLLAAIGLLLILWPLVAIL